MLSGVLTAEDEDAVEAELEEIIGQSLPNIPNDVVVTEPELPDVPVTSPGKTNINLLLYLSILTMLFFYRTKNSYKRNKENCSGSFIK